MPPTVNWLDLHWVTSADPWSQQGWRAVPWDLGSVGLLCSIGPLVFIFSKGLERASAQAFFRLYKRVGPEDTSRQAKFFN